MGQFIRINQMCIYSLVVDLLRKTVYIFVTDVFRVEDYLVTSICFVNVFHGKSPQFYSTLLGQLVYLLGIIATNKTI